MKRARVWVLIAIVAMMLATACVGTRAKEEVLLHNLTEMRRVIKLYTENNRKAPQSLQDLVNAGYFRELPVDPVTKSNQTWQPVVGTVAVSPGTTDRGVIDVHSGAALVSSKGTAYRTW